MSILFGTGKMSEEKITAMIRKVFPLKPGDILKQLDLKKPIYKKTASYGHFGRNEFPWEKLDKVKELKALAKKYRARRHDGDSSRIERVYAI